MLRSLLTTESMETEVVDADVGCNEEVDQASSGANDDNAASAATINVSGGSSGHSSGGEMADSEMKEEIVEEEVVSPEGEVDLANAADAADGDADGEGEAADADAASEPEAAPASATAGASGAGGTPTGGNGGGGARKDKSKGIGPVYHTPGSNMKLIKLVRKEPCLWDPRHVQYR